MAYIICAVLSVCSTLSLLFEGKSALASILLFWIIPSISTHRCLLQL